MTLLRSSTLLALLSVPSEAFRSGNSPQQQQQLANPINIDKAQPVASTVSEAPMPFKWPIVGTLPDFMWRGGVDAMREVHESMYREYGRVYGMSLMGQDELVFSDPRVFDQILRKEGKFPVGGAETVTSFIDYYEENDMTYALQSVSRGAVWKDWRTDVNPDLYVLWDTYLPVIAETCSKISKSAGREVTEMENLHVSDFLSRAAFDMFSAVLYGESPETSDTEKATPEDIEFVKATKRAFDITGALITNPLEKVMGSDLYKDFVVNMDKTVKLASESGMERIAKASERKASHESSLEVTSAELTTKGEYDSTNGSGSSSGCPVAAIKEGLGVGLNREKFIPSDYKNPSFIERLVNRGGMSNDKIVEAQTPLLMAGVDTTAYVMGWFYLNMASNPDVQAKLADHLRETLKGADVTTVEQMESLKHLKACFRESHRLTPAAPMSIKTLEEDAVVVDGDGRSYAIPAGQRTSLNLRGLPMDPSYVDDPDSFVPERFSPEAVAARKGTPSEIALDHPAFRDPFGRGKRRCLGANVAVAEMTVLAARLLQDWEISLVDPNEAVHSPTKTWKTKQKLMLIADPYPAMKFTPRRK